MSQPAPWEAPPRPPLSARGRWLLLAVLVPLLALPVDSEPVKVEEPGGCLRVAFDAEPLWASSLAWRPGGGWLLPDPGSGKVFLYTALGEPDGNLTRPGQGAYDFSKPVAVAPVDGALLLRDGATHWLWLDAESLEPVRQWEQSERPTPAGEFLDNPFSWDVTREGRVFASLHVYQADGTWWSGLGYYQLSTAPDFQRVREVDPSLPQARFHRLTLDTVATAGGKGYFLQFDDPVHILEVPGLRTLDAAVPEDLRHRPELPSTGPDQMGLLYRILESAPLAAGLFSHEDRLYLLERSPEEGGARWRMHQVDPDADRIVRTLDLPTRAHWIELAAGPEHWAILEKGPVRGVLDQEHHGLTLVPAAWLETSPSPLDPPARVECTSTP